MRFSRDAIQFLKRAGKARSVTWLDRNRADYERLVRGPIQGLAQHLKRELGPVSPGYHFPQKGLARMRGRELLFKSWMAYSASRPTSSRFDSNPNLYFMIDANDAEDPVLVAGGLYVPASWQLRTIRHAIAEDPAVARAFDALFADPEFAARFKGGFSRDRTATRPPRGFDPAHPRMEWLKLQAFFVWRPYSMREFESPRFAEIVAADWKQIRRMNVLLEAILIGGAVRPSHRNEATPLGLSRTLEDLGDLRAREMDF